EAIAAGITPEVQRAALRLSGSLASGAARLGYLRRALALAVPAADADELVGIATEWLEAGGPAHAVDAVLARAQAATSPPQALDRAGAAATRRGPKPRTAPVNGGGAVGTAATAGRRGARSTAKVETLAS